jgi:hypothetical protein
MIEKETVKDTRSPEKTIDYFKGTMPKLKHLNQKTKYYLLLKFGANPTEIEILRTETEINSLKVLPGEGIQYHDGFGSQIRNINRFPERISIMAASVDVDGEDIEVDYAILVGGNQYQFPPI